MVRTGVDIIEIDRMRVALLRTPSLELRLFTRAELDYCYLRRNPYGPLAARFCAKEATMKALGKGMAGSRFKEIEVGRLESGQPVLWLSGSASALAETLGVRNMSVSLSHSHSHAIAVATLDVSDDHEPDSGSRWRG